MNSFWRRLDNTAKVFSLDDKKNSNTFRLSVFLKENVDPDFLTLAAKKALDMYPSYKVKIRTGFFWNYLEANEQNLIIEEETKKSINNNGYLFKVTYLKNKINLDIFHVLTDGVGATIFLKEILYNYLKLKYNLKNADDRIIKKNGLIVDEYLKQADKKMLCKEQNKKAYLISKKSDLLRNKTYHYVLDLERFKSICKKQNISISEYLTSIYVYAIYNTIYEKSSNKDIIVSVPIDLRKHYHVESFSNFFTCMSIRANVVGCDLSFDKILEQVHMEFTNKLTLDNIKTYLARDVRLGTNIGIRLVPLFIKKQFMKYFGKLVNQSSTTTFSNIGPIKVEEQYKKYIDNIVALVSTGRIQKVKCTVCSYEDKLTVTLNSNLLSTKIEEEFYKLLSDYIDVVKLENNNS